MYFRVFLVKYGSEEKGSSLCKCSIFLGFIMSKNLRGLWFYVLIKVQNATSLVFLTWENPGRWSIYTRKNPFPLIRIFVQNCKWMIFLSWVSSKKVIWSYSRVRNQRRCTVMIISGLSLGFRFRLISEEYIKKKFKIQKNLMYVLSFFSKPEVAWKSIRAQNRMKTLV